MSHIRVSAIDRLAALTNTASNLQQAVIGVSNFNDAVQRRLHEREQQQKRRAEQAKESFKFNPEEIQTLVYRERKDMHDER